MEVDAATASKPKKHKNKMEVDTATTKTTKPKKHKNKMEVDAATTKTTKPKKKHKNKIKVDAATTKTTEPKKNKGPIDDDIPIFSGYKTKIPINKSSFANFLFGTWRSFSASDIKINQIAKDVIFSNHSLQETVIALRKAEKTENKPMRCHWSKSESQFGQSIKEINALFAITEGFEKAHICLLPKNMPQFHPCMRIFSHLKLHIAKYTANAMPLTDVVTAYMSKLCAKNMILRVVHHCHYRTSFADTRPFTLADELAPVQLDEDALDNACNTVDPAEIPHNANVGHLVCYAPRTNIIAKILPAAQNRWHILSQKTALFETLKGKILAEHPRPDFPPVESSDFLEEAIVNANDPVAEELVVIQNHILLLTLTDGNGTFLINYVWWALVLICKLPNTWHLHPAVIEQDSIRYIYWQGAENPRQKIVLRCGPKFLLSSICPLLYNNMFAITPGNIMEVVPNIDLDREWNLAFFTES